MWNGCIKQLFCPWKELSKGHTVTVVFMSHVSLNSDDQHGRFILYYSKYNTDFSFKMAEGVVETHSAQKMERKSQEHGSASRTETN